MKHLTAIMAAERRHQFGDSEEQILAMEGFGTDLFDKFKQLKNKIGLGSPEEIKQEFKDRQAAVSATSSALKAVRAEVAKMKFDETRMFDLSGKFKKLNLNPRNAEEAVKQIQELRVEIHQKTKSGQPMKERKAVVAHGKENAGAMKFTKEQLLAIMDSAIGMCDDYAAATSPAEAQKIAKQFENKNGVAAQEVFGDGLYEWTASLSVIGQIVMFMVIMIVLMMIPFMYLLGITAAIWLFKLYRYLAGAERY